MNDRNGMAGTPALNLGHLATDIAFVSRVLRAHIRGANASFFQAHDVASGTVAILCLIALNPGIAQKDLAEAVVLKKSAVTKLVNEMERSGLLERRKGDGDQRFNALHLTAAGTARHDELLADITAMQGRILADLAPDERRQLFDLLWRVIGTFGEPAKD